MKALKQLVSQIYYTHGLFCASHPLPILVIVCVIILLTCSPLLNLPLPGNAPLEFSTSKLGYSVPSRVFTPPSDNKSKDDLKYPRWYVGSPVGYVQQIVVKSVVSPWQQQQMIPADAFRAPLAKVFEVVQKMEDFQHQSRDGPQTLQEMCLHVSEPGAPGLVKSLLPQYSCLVVSPANLWFRDSKRFNKDGEIVTTIFSQYGQSALTPPTIKDLLFGVAWKDVGITRYFIRNRQRVITFAVTVVLKKYDEKFLDALKEKLEAVFPDTKLNVNNSEIDSLVHVHYKDFNYIVEYTPLLVTYFVLLLYIYFSVRKIEMVKSQIGLAVSAVVTVVSSLFMSLSLCFFFGLNPTLNGSEIFPYLVMIIGLENVLVITKSVVSTPVQLDVKIRVAQGLSKEGWYITKNLCTELLIIFFGFFTFVPAIQEFCLFALVGLWTDFFLQMFFFATILSVDIRRMELADLHRQSIQSQSLQQAEDSASEDNPSIQPLILCPFTHKPPSSPPPPADSAATPSPPPTPCSLLGGMGDSWQPSPKIYRSKSAPRLDLAFTQQWSPSAASPAGQDDFFEKMPRRLRLFYFWARTRIFQRLIMVCTVIWIALIVYKTGLVEHIANLEDSPTSSHPGGPQSHPLWPEHPNTADMLQEDGHGGAGVGWGMGRGGGEDVLQTGLVEHTQLETWRGLSHKHWPRLFAFYNISLLGRYISILPSIHLSMNVDAETAVKLRHPSEQQGYVRPPVVQPTGAGNTHPTSVEKKQNVWGNVGNGFHSIPSYMYDAHKLKAFYPKSQREFFITVCLCFLSVIVVSYFMVALYKCMCSRNYSRWRHSWARHYRQRQRNKGAYYKQIKESVPILLRGHSQEVECVAVDGQFVVSCCYGGQLRMWDSNTGECISTMQRHSITPPRRRKPCVGRNIEDSDADLYAEYHGGKMTPESTSSSEGSFIERCRAFERRAERNRLAIERYEELTPDLASTINTDFASIPVKGEHADSESGFDFHGWFQGVYDEHRRSVTETPQLAREQRIHSSPDDAFLSVPEDQRCRSWSQGDSPYTVSGDQLTGEEPDPHPASAIWCLTIRDGLIVAGCGNGRIEMWQGETGRLKYQYNNSNKGVTAICFVGNKVVAARMDGSLDFLELETFHNPSLTPQSPASTTRAHRGHARQYSLGNIRPQRLWEDTIRCHSLASLRAHQRPINCLLCEGDRIVSASHDHTLKVFRLEDQVCLYTLYGHEGSIGALCLDRCPPYAAASGSSDGSVRLWDLMTGTCTHKFKWHDEAVVQLATSLQFVVSLAQDDHMCVWERTRGQLVHKLQMEFLGGSIVLMSNNLGVIGVQGKLELWDLSRGEIVRKVALQDGEQAFVTHLNCLGANSLVCASGNLVSIVSFPTTLEKAE
ncbi:sterol regulatory element-binding protein cleavage-activating protein-like isoform X2 [Littorina saxatilis]|uniref:sterol regulatory element-binding protein cleavage-activating protein-like isoform X2 n=1 Tax=Littorina saxatilis TaxID=31220 RepID=UPI0038B5FBB1